MCKALMWAIRRGVCVGTDRAVACVRWHPICEVSIWFQWACMESTHVTWSSQGVLWLVMLLDMRISGAMSASMFWVGAFHATHGQRIAL